MPDLGTMQTLINAVGWMLIHFLWQGCVIAILLWAALRFSRDASSNVRYGWGLVACLAVIVVPAVTLLTLLNKAHSGWAPVVEELPSITVLANGVGAGGSRWLQLALEPVLPAVVGLWALGVALLSSRTLLGWWGARRLIRVGVTDVGDEMLSTLARLQALMGVARPVALLRSVKVNVPTVIGWIRPTILLPAGVILSLPAAQLEMVIAHELAHVRRWDYLVNLLQLVVETLFFYHPAVRWISRQVRQEREHCCDDLVVARCGERVTYARALTRLETLRGHACSPAMAATGGDLFMRVSRIVQREAPKASSGMAQLWLVTGIALVAVLGAGKGIDATFRQPISGFPQADALAADGGRLAALGQGWSRHLDQWSPPDSRKQVDSARPVAKQPAVPSAIESLPVPVGEPDSATSDDSDDTFLPPRTPAMPLLASLTPPTTVRREDIALPGAGARMDGQANVMPLFTVNPRYPEAALQQGLEGQVKLRFKVDLQGRAVDIEVIHSQPESVFDHAAIEALQQWTFQVNTGHDTGLLLAQAFDFSWEEVNEPSRRLHAKDCLRTGTRVCAYPYTDEHVVKFRPQSAAINEPK